MICVVPSTLVEVICETPEICANCVSSGCATEDAMISGLAPGSCARHQDGREVDLRQRCDRQEREGGEPDEEQPRHQQRGGDRALDEGLRDVHGACSAGLRRAPPWRSFALMRAAGLQAVLVAGHDLLAGLESLLDHDEVAVLRADGERRDRHRRVRLHDVGEDPVRAALERARRNGERLLLRRWVSTRMLTNSPGQRRRCLLGSVALTRIVPVVWSIWLSMSATVPWSSSFAFVARQGDHAHRSALQRLGQLRRNALPGAMKITEIGSICVTTTMPVVSLACTLLPGSTRRMPVRPSIGERMLV